MTEDQFVEKMAQLTPYSKEEVREALDAKLELVSEAVAGEVDLSDLDRVVNGEC